MPTWCIHSLSRSYIKNLINIQQQPKKHLLKLNKWILSRCVVDDGRGDGWRHICEDWPHASKALVKVDAHFCDVQVLCQLA